MNFDVVVAKDIAAPPYLTIKVDLCESSPIKHHPEKDEKFTTDWHSLFLNSASYTSRSEHTIVLSNHHLAVQSPGGRNLYELSSLSEEDVQEIFETLSPPESLPSGVGDHFPPGHHPHQTKLTRWLFADSEITPEYREVIETEFFEIDVNEYSDLLYSAYSADSPVKKGNSLEEVVEYLLSGLKMVDIRDTNLNTKTGEIDVVLQYSGFHETNLFQYHSRFILIECKNVGESVSTKEVGHFEKKLRKRQVDIGIIVAWNGVSGEESGEDAQRYIDTPSPEDPFIIVLDSDDLYSILDGRCLYDIIDDYLYRLRFDV